MRIDSLIFSSSLNEKKTNKNEKNKTKQKQTMLTQIHSLKSGTQSLQFLSLCLSVSLSHTAISPRLWSIKREFISLYISVVASSFQFSTHGVRSSLSDSYSRFSLKSKSWLIFYGIRCALSVKKRSLQNQKSSSRSSLLTADVFNDTFDHIIRLSRNSLGKLSP